MAAPKITPKSLGYIPAPGVSPSARRYVAASNPGGPSFSRRDIMSAQAAAGHVPKPLKTTHTRAAWLDQFARKHGVSKRNAAKDQRFKDLWNTLKNKASTQDHSKGGALATALENAGFRQSGADYPVGDTPGEK